MQRLPILLAVLALISCKEQAEPSPQASPPAVEHSEKKTEPAPDDARARKLAEEAARAWLQHLDAGDYGVTWESATDLFRNTTTRDSWISRMQTIRTPLGKRISLALTSATLATTVPGAPDGRHVILIFSSSFQNKAKATETLTISEVAPDVWRLTIYYMK